MRADQILIVYAKVIERERIASALQEHGYKTQSTSSVREALALMREQRPLLMILGPTAHQEALSAVRVIRMVVDVREVPIAIFTTQAQPSRRTLHYGENCVVIEDEGWLPRVQELIEAAKAKRTDAAIAESPLNDFPSTAVVQDTGGLDKVQPQPCASSIQLGRLCRSDLFCFIRKRFSSPPLTPAMKEVMPLIESPDSGVDEIARAIEFDRALSTQILQFANTAGYGRGQSVECVKLAVQRIGLHQLKRVVLTLGVLEGFPEYSMGHIGSTGFWLHSFGTGLAAGEIAGAIGMSADIEYLVSGVLHDVGRLILLDYAPGTYGEVLRFANQKGEALAEAEERLLGIDHCDVLNVVLSLWKFPANLIESITSHHKTTEALHRAKDATAAMVMALANRLAHRLSLGESGDRATFSTDELVEELGIEKRRFATIMEELPSQVKSLKSTLFKSIERVRGRRARSAIAQLAG